MTQKQEEGSAAQLYRVPHLYPKIKDHTQTCYVRVPGSKSITNRALLLATLADGPSVLKGALFSDDSRHFLKCVQDLGFEADADEEQAKVVVKGLGGKVPFAQASQYVGSAGTAARFLTAYLGLSNGIYHMDASAQMRRRPMAPLLDSLKELGCEVLYDADGCEGHFPFTLKSHGFQKDHITVNIDTSSQFMSALLIASCLSGQDFTAAMEGSHGRAYIDMTVKMMAQFGVSCDALYSAEQKLPYAYQIKAGQHYLAQDYQIEPDVSAACYFYAMSPLLGIPVLVDQVHFQSLQGDVAFIHILEQMGCSSRETADGILLLPPADGSFHGVTVDMSACSDQAITLAAIAPFADSPTTITGIGHIRFQESDRMRAITTELTKMGITCEETNDSITIYPGTPASCMVDTYDDHRMAMGFALTGLRSEGIAIRDPGCCRKTFETYFQVLDEVIEKLL